MEKPRSNVANSVAVVVSSCDAFFDCWRPFAFFYRKFWPACPFPVYLIVNELRVRSDFIQPLVVGRDQGWASNMQKALGQIDEPYILYFQEDYFLTRPVDEVQLADDIRFAQEHDAASFCFADLSLLEPDFSRSAGRYNLIPRESTGRTRLQVTLWERERFTSLLRPGENAWNMEARGSERTRDLIMYSYGPESAPPIPYLGSAIVRGLWTPEALELCRQYGVSITPHFRSTLATSNRGRRWRRALGRARLALALARQKNKPVDLNAANDENAR